MAKGNNSVTGRRSSSRNAKPYDANNSFVKKVATKVTDLIPQRSWISKWFNLSQDSEKPPPLKRLCIRMDVTHPPGTFSIQPGAKAPLNNVSPSKEQYSVHDEMVSVAVGGGAAKLKGITPTDDPLQSEDFSEPAMAGPSGMSHLISSTPAAQSDVRDINAQRSELNSLVAATNNGTANGMDDNSESSESTSGCSSLIPQTNRQEAPTNVSYNSPFSNRKRFNNEKLNFAARAQSPRSLFLDSNRDSLSSRRPSFNASVMTNTPDRASPLSSPFYSGNITFGGANAAGLYKRGRNLFDNSNEIQLKVPRRTSVEVKPSKTAGVDSSGMSQTAKKILEALEHFSSPITDAKKIPVKLMNNMSSLGKKRMRDDETSPPAKVGLRHLTRELTVPTVPEILKLRRRQKLQDTTVAARRIVSARCEPPPPQEYHLRTQTKEDSKHHGKLKGKATNLDQEETVEPVNLPSIPLPISSLPNFNFVPPAKAKTVDKSCADKNETFTFASPIKITNTTKNLKSINNFTFSSPISADKQLIDDTTDSSSPAKRVCTKSGTTSSSRVPTVTQNFMWSGSSTAPRPKEKVKNGGNAVPTASNELKSGSVMDILCSKSNKTAAEKSSETKAQLQSNKDTKNKTNAAASGASKTNATKAASLKSNVQQDSSTMWECPECLIKNDNSEAQCFACKTAKSSHKDNKARESSLAPKNIKESEAKASDPFGSQFKLSSSQWECASCYVRNKEADAKCVACSGPKPGFKNKTKSTPTKLMNSELGGKSLEESWECPNCKLKNSACSTACSSCKTSKSNLLKASPKKGKGFASETNTLVNQKTGTSTGSSLNNSTLAKTETMDNFKPSKDTWECPCCMVRNVTTVDSCPCCNTAKPNSGGATKAAPLLANGFGDQFKKPEGAWNCDACMLQNKPSDTECIACGGSKPGSKKSGNSATNATSNLQFNFGIPPSAGGFKFGIDKADQQKADNVTPTNGFKFGESQPSSQPGQFTFGIQKEETKKSETSKSGSSEPSTAASGFGFQINPKNSEKTDAKQSTETIEKKQTPPFSFGIPKTESGAVEKNKQPANTSSSTMLPPAFTFGVPKSEVKQPEAEKGKQGPLLGNTVTEVPKPSTEATASPAVTSTSTLPSVTRSSLKEAKPTGIFSFGVSSSTAGATGSTSTSVVTSLPSTQSSFAFPETRPMQAATVPTFGQLPATASTSSSTFTFCESKITDGISSSKTFGALSSSSSTTSMFSSLSNAPPLFGNSDAKTAPTFGTPENKKPAFGASASKPSAFAMPETKVPTFGSTETKPSIFRASDTKIPVFGSTDNKTTPLFNPTPQAPTATPTPTPTFNAPTATPTPTFNAPSATPNLFGSSVTPVFGSNASSTFTADTSKPNIFAPTTKQGETNAPSPNLFTFTGTAAQPVAPPATGFNFSANTNPAGPNHKPMFTFGSTATAPQNNNVFGGTFNAPAPSNPGFTFNAPKPDTPAFNQPTVTSSIFGAPPPGAQDQQPASFSSAPPNAGFNFGSTAPAAPSGGFNFGAVAPAAAPPAGYNFNPPPAAPTFDPNTPPSFNFTGGNTPTVFSGTPQAVTQRKIKKAFRRMR